MAVVGMGGIIPVTVASIGASAVYVAQASSQRRTKEESCTKCEKVINELLKRSETAGKLQVPFTRALVQHLQSNPSQTKTVVMATEVQKFWRTRTPLGKTLAEVQYSQESPDRALLSKETLLKADEEAERLLRELLDGASVTRFIDGTSVIMWSKNGVPRARLVNADRSPSGRSFRIALNPEPQDHSFKVTISDGMFIFVWERNNLAYARVRSMTPQTAISESPGMDLVVSDLPCPTGTQVSLHTLENGQVTIQYYEKDGARYKLMVRPIDSDGIMGPAREIQEVSGN